MYLEKLEVQGFKSFANKNILEFPGMLNKSKRGITAVVGPNGSGKSNVADAVRWALGEQSMKTLRGKKSEDIIFSGSDKKGKLGMAEVSLYLNNEDRQAPLDYEQIIITRRLYRSGDSEYLINNSRVRLGDIQMLLAKANFGQKTYSVIGQGMVEGFLDTSLSERKEFFDEATGVKQFQIKRDDSLNKLRNSYENLIQAQMLLNEIEPRLKSLTRQVNRLHKRDELENELRGIQKRYYAVIWQDINIKFNKRNKEFLELEKEKFAKDKRLEQLNTELEKMKQEEESSREFDKWQAELSVLQAEKDNLNKKLARYDAQIEVNLESKGQFDVSFLISKQDELFKEIKKITEEIDILNERVRNDENKKNDLNKEKQELDRKIDKINTEIKELNTGHDKSERSSARKQLREALNDLKSAGEEDDLVALKKNLISIKEQIEKALLFLAEEEDEENRTHLLKELPNKLKLLSARKEDLSLKINDNNLRLTARGERIKLLKERQVKLKDEYGAVKKKLDQVSGHLDIGDISAEQHKIKEEISKVDAKIKNINEKIGFYNSGIDDKRRRLFNLQQQLSDLQSEINEQNNALNEIKIQATRYETRLEDLEMEIREELSSIKEVREFKIFDEDREKDNLTRAKEKINYLKRQLEQIGGIDPQTENEYKEAKERFDFLSSQVNDLTKAVDSLEKIIKELDVSIKERFDKEFKLIGKKFEEYFKILFKGGNAKIIKVMEASLDEQEKEEKEEEKNKLDRSAASLSKVKFLQKHNATGLAGIEIQATPPGKKIKTVTMLSGGERALTAIALICAIISSNPSPFVVLDEADAALDEANSERLANILDELSHKTQFIVITHNRASMRKANVLYGITMGDDGVSKLFSVKLDEVESVVKDR